MADLKSKTRSALGEDRILVLMTTVMVGFQFQAVFQTGFDRLPGFAQSLMIGGLGLFLIALTLLIAPASYHRIVEAGNEAATFQQYVTAMVGQALLPFAIGFAIDFYIVGRTVVSPTAGIVIGVTGLVVALGFWFGLGLAARRPGESEGIAMAEKERSPLKDRVEEVLMEASTILPGVQALLGFQFTVILTNRFAALADPLKYLHTVGMGFTALAGILLMTPAAFHRLALRGEDSEAFHTFASRVMLAAMVCLASGVSIDFTLVVQVVVSPVK